MSTETIDFNINTHVQFQLTERGKSILRHKQYPPTWRDIGEGWHRAQLWDLMSELGEHCYMGPQPPFNSNIRLEISK
jgi:hypothetical protein